LPGSILNVENGPGWIFNGVKLSCYIGLCYFG